ncbi:MAG: lipooligosaccharide transport system ATP-binding protein [Clostridia bacterium]|nr:lipooligosaccharide transport system ATP-binding protein [Clostridia bacterium]
MLPVVLARDLVKRYNELVAVDGISFTVRQQECFGFLGPNGAGKTTTVKMICCFTPATSGELQVLGLDVRQHPRAIKAQIGVVPQEDNLDPELTVRENLLLYASYFDLPRGEAITRAEELLAFVELSDKASTEVEHLSGGMKRRLTIARALINRPRLLILDEPTTGLDPEARQLIWQKLRQLKAGGVTLILTTHYMEEAARLCDRLVIMDRGRILEEGSPEQLVQHEVGREVLELGLDGDNCEEVLAFLDGNLNGHQVIGETLFLYGGNLDQLWENLKRSGYNFSYYRRRPATLEDVFLKLTGRGLRE